MKHIMELLKMKLVKQIFPDLVAFANIGFRRIENIYLQHLNGFISDDAFQRIGWDYFKLPTFKRNIR